MSSSRPKPYPYNIPPVECPCPEVVKDLNPWKVLEFFRIEALLRCESVLRLYNTTNHAGKENASELDQLRAKYQVEDGWGVLQGSHHKTCLNPKYSMVRVQRLRIPQHLVAPGIVDMSAMIALDAMYAKHYLDLFTHPRADGPRAVLFSLDPAQPPEATIKALRPYLAKLHRPYRNKVNLETYFLDGSITVATAGKRGTFETYKKVPVREHRTVKNWLDYLRCYDLHNCDALSFGKIARLLYGGSGRKGYDHARKAYERARQLIYAAEHNKWPPSLR